MTKTETRTRGSKELHPHDSPTHPLNAPKHHRNIVENACVKPKHQMVTCVGDIPFGAIFQFKDPWNPANAYMRLGRDAAPGPATVVVVHLNTGNIYHLEPTRGVVLLDDQVTLKTVYHEPVLPPWAYNRTFADALTHIQMGKRVKRAHWRTHALVRSANGKSIALVDTVGNPVLWPERIADMTASDWMLLP